MKREICLTLTKSKVGLRRISSYRVLPYQIGMTAIVMGDVNAVYTLECAHRRQLLAVAHWTNVRCCSVDCPSCVETCTLMTSSFSVFCNFQTCMSFHRPSKCSEPMLCTISSPMLAPAGKSGSTLEGGVLGRTPGWRFRHTRTPSCAPSFAHAHHDAARCCGRKSDAPAAPPGRMGMRPCFSAISVRLP